MILISELLIDRQLMRSMDSNCQIHFLFYEADEINGHLEK